MKLIIKKIEIQNFLSIGNIELEFSNKDTVLIQGFVEDSLSSDSNGSGKSSIIEALNWCLFDETLKRVKKDDVINNKIGKDTFVSVFLEINGVNINIIRYRNHKEFKNQVKLVYNDKDISESSDIKTNAKIKEILSMNFEDFQTNIIFSNNSMKFLELGDTDRKKLFDDIIRSDLYEKCIDLIKFKLKNFNEELNNLNLEKNIVIGKIESSNLNYKNLKEQSENFELEKNIELSSLTNKEIELKDLFKKNENIEEYDKRISNLEFKIENIQKDINNENIKLMNVGRNNEFLQQKENLINCVEIKNIEEKLKIENQKLNDFRISVSNLQFGIKNVKEKLDHKKDVLKIINDEIENYTLNLSKNVCPVCKQKLPINESNTLEFLNNENNKKYKEEIEIEELNQKKLDVEKELNNITEIGKSKKDEILQIDEELKLKKEDIQKSILLINEQIDLENKNVEESKKQALIEIDLKNKEIGELRIKIDEINKAKNETQRVLDKLEYVKKEIERVNNSKNVYLESLNNVSIQIEEYNKELLNFEIEIVSKQSKIDNYKYWINGFKKIKGLLISTITPIMNEKALEYSRMLTSGEFEIKFVTQRENKDGSSKEVFDIEVAREDGGCKYCALSSGEKRRVDLITIFVLDELKKINCIHDLNIRFYDEIFDSLDEIGIEKVVELLKVISQNKEVYVISHRQDLKDLFNKCLTIIKKDGISKIF